MSPLTVVYIVTAVIGVLTALILAQMAARQSTHAKVDSANKPRQGGYVNAAGSESLKQTILKEISPVVGSRQQSQEISSRLSEALNRELEKKVSQNNEELSRKYETIIKDKTKNEEIAWNKYEKVLTDKKKTEAVIRSIAEGLVVVDASGKVVMMNPAAEKLLGVSKKDKIGKPVSENLKEEQLVSLSRESPGKEGREIELVSEQDETKKILRASSAVIENENGQTVGMVSVLSDITKQKELDRLKANFVASVSHELRTPLVAIDKSISLILNKNAGEITETQEQFLTIAARNLKRLSTLVNDLLDLSKLEAGRMEMRRKPAAIGDVINESVAGLSNWAKTKSVNLEAKVSDGLPETEIDPDRIIQVLNNLIGNAIKFTPNNGTVTVEAGLASGSIEVSVRDTGIGIAKENLTKIFDKFYQVGERVSTDINGTGIGLSIAKEIVELHGGRIWAESEESQGTKFTFTLPLKSSQAA